jgi:hypothetical protein
METHALPFDFEVKKINGNFVRLNVQHSTDFEVIIFDFKNEKQKHEMLNKEWHDGFWKEVPPLSEEDTRILFEKVKSEILKNEVAFVMMYADILGLESRYLRKGGDAAYGRYNLYAYLYKGTWYNETECSKLKGWKEMSHITEFAPVRIFHSPQRFCEKFHGFLKTFLPDLPDLPN